MMRKLMTWLIAACTLTAAVCPNTATAQSAAMNYTKAFRYDSGGRLLGTISAPPTVGTSANFLATRNTYDSQGRLSKVESGVLSSWKSDAVAPASWGTAFIVKKTVNYSYDMYGNKSQETVAGSGGAVAAVTQYTYDAYDRPVCTAVRMDSTKWLSQTDACTPQTTASVGPDRITKMYYDSLGRIIQEWEGVGTPAAAAVATKSWTPDSKLQYMVDANGNKAQMVYDNYGRLQCWIFPSKTAPTSYDPTSQSTALSTSGAVSGDCVSGGDYEKYGYDSNGNRTSLRKRDGTTLTYDYDALNRVRDKIVPSRADLTAAQTRDVYYSYDLLGHQLSANFDSATGADAVTDTYDPFGELLTTTTAMGAFSKTVGSPSDTYDADGNRTLLTHPDGHSFSYAYDGLDRLKTLYEGTGTTTPLESFTWATDGTLGSRTEGTSGSSATYTPDTLGLLKIQQDAFSSTGSNNTWTFTRNPANQIATETRSNSNYLWTGAVGSNRNYTVNGLNQYTAAGSAGFTFDANGNLTSDGTWTYTYDIENRLVHATGAGKDATLAYDPLGRLYFLGGSNIGDVEFIHYGDALIAEYSASTGNMTNRYVHGSDVGADDPLVRYIGSAVGSSNRRYLHADHEGSIIAESDGTGANVAINTYDEYGIPASTNDGRFGYTGQAYLYEIGLDYYKARMYSPTLGRFIQTDPIGYDGGINIYAYVGDDPIDRHDPTGLAGGKQCPATTIDPTSPPCITGQSDDDLLPSPAVTTTSAVGVEATGSVAAGATAAALAPALLLSGDTPHERVYITYTKRNDQTGQVYSGRSSMVVPLGTPLTPQLAQSILNTRESGHHMNLQGFGPARLDQISDDYFAIRGREQQLINHFGGARASGGTSGNAINGISVYNPLRALYLKASTSAFGYLKNNSSYPEGILP